MLKICGLNRIEDVELCNQLPVDLLGFIFAPLSPRCLTPEQAKAMPRGPGLRVGVFVNESLDNVRQTMEIADLDLAQLHGDETPEYCRSLGQSRVIKTLWPRRYKKRAELEQAMAQYPCRYFLLDGGEKGGGGGNTLNWPLLRGLPFPWLLAGGIGPHNAELALSQCQPAGLDVNSAIEAGPGVKDHVKLRALLAALERIPFAMTSKISSQT